MLDVVNITYTYNPGTIDEKKALDGLSLHADSGDFITVIGANGAGKSTLFNAISGGVLTDSGKILLDGTDITLMKEHKRSKRIGRLFQDPMRGTAPDMTIEENLFLASGRGGVFGTIKDSDRDLFREELKKLGMGLEDRLSHKVGLLSGGQRQAITLLMATINPPDLLLLDEHTAALDPATADKVLAITKDVVEKNHLTCMMITHNMQSALDLGNRTIMMDRGRIIFDISGEERRKTTVPDLLDAFKRSVGTDLSNDRMLLNPEKGQ